MSDTPRTDKQLNDHFYDATVSTEFINFARTLERDNQQLRDAHCKDCCCAQSWKALGVCEYTGKSIPEHIEQLREDLRQCAEALRHAQTILIDEQIDKALALPAVQDALK